MDSWKVRNAAKASPEGRFTDAYFFRVWTNILSPFLRSNYYMILSEDSVSRVIESFTLNAAPPSLPLQPPTPPTEQTSSEGSSKEKTKGSSSLGAGDHSA